MILSNPPTSFEQPLMAVLPKLFLPQNPFAPFLLHDFKLLTLFLCQELAFRPLERTKTWIKTLNLMRCKRSTSSEEAESFREIAATETTVLDLPELALDSILAKLSPAELCSMACVCGFLRDKCRGDELWERHVREKWSRVIGERRHFGDGEAKTTGMIGKFVDAWPASWIKNKMGGERKCRRNLRANSLADFYLALETGRLSFPAQVFNRENEHTGFMMSCYDAEITYNARTNKFLARYQPHGKRVAAAEAVPWERARAPAVLTPANELHISDCLCELNPGDHFEIQWRRNKKFPYGWWYGVVGHLELCGTAEHHCSCNASDSVVLEFRHYALGSRWRRKIINRNEHREDGDENDGFYGGIRKVEKKEDISMWMQFWPAQVLD